MENKVLLIYLLFILILIFVTASIHFIRNAYRRENMKFGKKKNKKPEMHRIKSTSQDDIDEGLRRAFSGAKKSYNQQPQQPRKQVPKKRKRLSIEIPEPEPEEDEPYWSGQDWEEWAYSIYMNYPKYRQFLPTWFNEAMQEELNQRR